MIGLSHPSELRRRFAGALTNRGAVCRFAALWSVLLLAAACPDPAKSNRTTPICAVRDCKTGEIIDDGCVVGGKCKSCVNDCGGRVAPRNGPISPLALPSPRR